MHIFQMLLVLKPKTIFNFVSELDFCQLVFNLTPYCGQLFLHSWSLPEVSSLTTVIVSGIQLPFGALFTVRYQSSDSTLYSHNAHLYGHNVVVLEKLGCEQARFFECNIVEFWLYFSQKFCLSVSIASFPQSPGST